MVYIYTMECYLAIKRIKLIWSLLNNIPQAGSWEGTGGLASEQTNQESLAIRWSKRTNIPYNEDTSFFLITE